MATSPGFELNGIDHSLQHAGWNLHLASKASGEELSRWRPLALPYRVDQLAESLHTELQSFLQTFAVRLEAQETALKDAALELRRSSEQVLADVRKRSESFLEAALSCDRKCKVK